MVIIASAFSQGTSYFFKLIVDAVEADNARMVITYALLYPVAVFAVQALYRISGYFGRKWAVNSRKYTYDTLTRHILQHGHSYFSDRFAGSILSKVNNITNAIDDTIPDFLWTHLNALVSFIVTFGFILSASVWAAVTFVVLTIVLFAINRRFAPKKTELSRLNAEAGTILRGRIVDIFSNVQAVRQYTQRSFEETAVSDLSAKLRDTHDNNWGYTEKMLYWNSFVLLLFSLVMFGFLAASWREGQIGTGDFVLILSLYAQITGTLIFIGRAFNGTARAIGEMREGLDDILVLYEVNDDRAASKLKVREATIDWQNVNFNFHKHHVFRDFNLKIEAGERVGLVGPSGAGKSTFVSLLLRQHDIQKGAILIDGQNIAKVTQDSLRQQIAVVPQEPLLFHRSIRENIAYGKPNASEKEIVEVAKKAQAYDFIKELPEEFETLVGERGVKLSGGQKQRVAIARAMLKDAPILVLDEATSALDSESEVAIQKALHELMEGKTVVAIAHRLSTLREMDRILVLENGQIVEDGTHATLALSGGTYQRLWEHQAGGFLQE